MRKESANWKKPDFFFFAFLVCLISFIYTLPFVDFNMKLICMILLIFVTYYMVIEYKKVGSIFVSIIYLMGFTAVAMTSKFEAYHTNAVMAFQVATLISIYYLNDYVGKNEAANQKLYEHSIIDDLTGIYNKRYYRIKADEELARAKRYKHKFAIILLDVDHFKSINDTHGHLFGDEILKRVAAEVGKSIRKEDSFCRYGGDEFILLVSNYSELGKRRIIERIDDSIRRVNEQIAKDREESISVSLGFGIYPDHAIALDDLFSHADKEMYQAKMHADHAADETYQLESGMPATPSL